MNPDLLKCEEKRLLTKEEFLNSGYFNGYNIITSDVLNEAYNDYKLKFYGYN